jgi:hypothetical protein
MKFNSIIKRIIVEEVGRYEILLKTYTEPKKKDGKVKPARMSKEQLDTIVLADPTTRREGDEIKKAGKYTQWLLKQFLSIESNVDADYGTPQFNRERDEKVRLYFEDLYKTTEDLEKFERFKGQLDLDKRDISGYTIETLFDAVRDFSLEKTKASKEEKKEAAKTYEHPGSEVIFKGNEWTVIKIEDQGELGKDAACFYGGNNLKSSKGETNWCTSSPGLNYFNTYIKQGPLYIIIPNQAKSFYTDTLKTGQVSGLPALRYQFHFPSNQFMDPDDRQIDLIDFLNKNEELKEIFKDEFMKGLTSSNGKEISVEFPKDSASKFISIYGFDEFFDTIPNDIIRLDFVNTSPSKNDIAVKIPPSVSRFKNLESFHVQGIVESIPKEISDLTNLMFLSLPDNPKLKTLPKEIAKKNGDEYAMKNLVILNLLSSPPSLVIPKEILNMVKERNIRFLK